VRDELNHPARVGFPAPTHRQSLPPFGQKADCEEVASGQPSGIILAVGQSRNQPNRREKKRTMRRKAKRIRTITRQRKTRIANTPRKAKERARKQALRAPKAKKA
jgi:hypothetical protein